MMDLNNNRVGRKIARQNPDATEEELAQIVQEALDSGKLMKVRMDTDGNYIDYEGNRIDTSLPGWKKHKVLVPSYVPELPADQTRPPKTNNNEELPDANIDLETGGY